MIIDMIADKARYHVGYRYTVRAGDTREKWTRAGPRCLLIKLNRLREIKVRPCDKAAGEKLDFVAVSLFLSLSRLATSVEAYVCTHV